MLLSLRKNGLTSLFKEVRVFQGAFRTLPKHFWTFCLFWHLYQAGRVPTQIYTWSARLHYNCYIGSGKKHIKKKTRKQIFHGIVPGVWGEFCLCVFLPHKEWPEKKNTHKQICGTHPVSGQSRIFVYVYVFFSFPDYFLCEILDTSESTVINNVCTRCIVKTSGFFARGVCKYWWFYHI